MENNKFSIIFLELCKLTRNAILHEPGITSRALVFDNTIQRQCARDMRTIKSWSGMPTISLQN